MMSIENYKPLILGKITKFEAGVIYKAMKQDKIKVLPETISTLYDESSMKFGYYNDRYCSNRDYFDKIYLATEYILNNEYEKAQYQLEAWQRDIIEHCGKKSIFYKYK